MQEKFLERKFPRFLGDISRYLHRRRVKLVLDDLGKSVYSACLAAIFGGKTCFTFEWKSF